MLSLKFKSGGRSEPFFLFLHDKLSAAAVDYLFWTARNLTRLWRILRRALLFYTEITISDAADGG